MEMISILEILKYLLGIIQDESKLAIFLPQSVKLRLSVVASAHLSLAAFPEFVVVRDK